MLLSLALDSVQINLIVANHSYGVRWLFLYIT